MTLSEIKAALAKVPKGKKKILIACEFSGTVRDAITATGGGTMFCPATFFQRKHPAIIMKGTSWI